jgi:hypothetical protein
LIIIFSSIFGVNSTKYEIVDDSDPDNQNQAIEEAQERLKQQQMDSVTSACLWALVITIIIWCIMVYLLYNLMFNR